MVVAVSCVQYVMLCEVAGGHKTQNLTVSCLDDGRTFTLHRHHASKEALLSVSRNLRTVQALLVASFGLLFVARIVRETSM